MRNIFWIAAFCCFIFALPSHAQTGTTPTLSVQGILKKANGVAVDDGTYSMTFRLYTAESGGTAIWSENQSNIDVSSGIYSATLGTVEPLNAAFTQLYYLGVSIGATEMKPRVLLTSAPYALALIGQSNRFPSSGKVVADTVKIATTLEVGGKITASGGVSANGGILAGSGAPGAAGANNKGYGFNGDGDTGMFSTSDGRVSFFSNNTEVASVASGNLTVQGTVNANSVVLPNGGTVTYNGRTGWRLVEDDFFGGSDGWSVYNPAQGQNTGWNNANAAGAATVLNRSGFVGNFLYPANNNQVLKKNFDLSGVTGAYSFIKIKFKYYLIDSWDFTAEDRAWAAVATNASGGSMHMGWERLSSQIQNSGELGNDFFNACNFAGGNNPDHAVDGEMTFARNGNGFWLYFGAALNGDINDESYGVGMIEVWVK